MVRARRKAEGRRQNSEGRVQGNNFSGRKTRKAEKIQHRGHRGTEDTEKK
jgi:hypothetical protein